MPECSLLVASFWIGTDWKLNSHNHNLAIVSELEIVTLNGGSPGKTILACSWLTYLLALELHYLKLHNIQILIVCIHFFLL